MSNSLDPDQERRLVRPDLGPNCSLRLSADSTGRQKVNRDDLNLCITKTQGFEVTVFSSPEPKAHR